MPAQSWQLCDPAYLNDPDVPQERWEDIRLSLPVYDAATTPTRTMGAVAELFRTLPGTMRSSHPHRSIAVSGPVASRIVARHELADPCGETSPLGVLYEVDARVLLLGVGYGKCTALHLAEDRSEPPGRHDVTQGAALIVDGVRRWVTWHEPWPSDEDFDEVGATFAATGASFAGRSVGRTRDLSGCVTWWTSPLPGSQSIVKVKSSPRTRRHDRETDEVVRCP